MRKCRFKETEIQEFQRLKSKENQAVILHCSSSSMHEKHQPCSSFSCIQEAVELVSGTLRRVLRSNENSIRDEVANLPRTLNGPQGNVASKTVESVQMLKCDLEKLQQVLELHGYDALNLLSCITLDVENIHSAVHHNFGMSTTHWAAIYFTNPKS